jgi:lysophospholipase L1-like esterase
MVEVNRPGFATEFRRRYTRLGLILLNTVVLFLLLNLGLTATFGVWDFFRGPIRATGYNPVAQYGDALLSQTYPGWNRPDLYRLMAETYNYPVVFEPFTQFMERPRHGKYVNVAPAGFRVVKDQGPWPPRPENFNVFYFGGSTTFGYGLPDDQAIPSYLQEILSADPGARRLFVYNFGRSNYFSQQERIAFEHLILSGHVPDLTIFMDGMNDFIHSDGVPAFSDQRVPAAGEDDPEGGGDRRLLETVPLVRAARAIRRRLFPTDPPPTSPGAPPAAEDPSIAERVVDRWFANKAIAEAIGEKFSVPLLFVWQPAPTFDYDLAYHPFGGTRPDRFDKLRHSIPGYPLMRSRMEARKPSNFLWLADMQHDRKEALYVDLYHYNAAFSREIALRIADRIRADGLICDPRGGRGAVASPGDGARTRVRPGE